MFMNRNSHTAEIERNWYSPIGQVEPPRLHLNFWRQRFVNVTCSSIEGLKTLPRILWKVLSV